MATSNSDVRDFISTQTLFEPLSDDQIEFASKHILIAFAKSGALLSLSDGSTNPSPGLIMVRSGSLEIRDSANKLLDRLASGDFFLVSNLGAGEHVEIVSVLEDCLYYELAEFALQTLLANNRQFAILLSNMRSLPGAHAIRKQDAKQRDLDLEEIVEAKMDGFVRDAMSKHPVTADPCISIADAAKLMSESGVSSLLLVEKNKMVGIVTDRDFRNRVLAGGISSDEAVKSVMTNSPLYIHPSALLHQAQLQMMASKIHHLPVLDEDTPVGILTLNDVLRAHNIEPLSLSNGIQHAASLEDLIVVSKNIPGLVAKLIERDARAEEIGEIITSLTDAITQRLMTIAHRKYGEPPCDYAWLAFGSQARREQTLGSDQDNGIILGDDADEDAEKYFRQFTDYVNKGLDKCGMPLCPGDIMACNKKWRMTLTNWKARFRTWIEERSPKALMHASIFFDMRKIYGSDQLFDDLHAYVLDMAKSNTIFLALMCENALLHSPPLGFFKSFVLERDGNHEKSLDLKKRGTIPIVDFARNYALSSGVEPVNTMKRLRMLAEKGVCSKSLADNLVDAHEFIAVVRLKAQARKYLLRENVDNFVDPKVVSALVRQQLKDAFHVVQEAQAAMRAKFGAGYI